MSLVEDHIKRLGAQGIVLISSSSGESASTHVEWTTETIACLIDGQAFRLKVTYSDNVLKGSDYTEHEREAITHQEYQALRATYGTEDTPATHQRVARRQDLRDQLDALKPRCPKCSREMTSRSGTRGKFWGCKSYPNCTGTRSWDASLDAQMKALWDELGTLR